MSLMYWLLLIVCCAGIYVLWDMWRKEKKAKEQGKLVRVFMYEHTGKDKVYIGEFKGFERTDEKLGVYLELPKFKTAIAQISSSDFFPDKKYGKCVHLCKYSSDDFRPISRLNNEEWLRQVQRPAEEYLETEEYTDEEDGETKLKLKQDKHGNFIPKKDKDGKEIPPYKLVQYEEPLGVDQGAREALRFNLAFTKRMQEKRKEQPGFWDKYGNIIMYASILLIVFISIAYTVNKTNEAHIRMTEIFKEEADKIVEKVNNPDTGFVQSLLDKIEKRNVEQAAPQK